MKDNPTAIVSFNSSEFGNLRTYEEHGQILFCGKDVATALGYTNPNKALGDHCYGVTKRYPIVDKRPKFNLDRYFFLIMVMSFYSIVMTTKGGEQWSIRLNRDTTRKRC